MNEQDLIERIRELEKQNAYLHGQIEVLRNHQKLSAYPVYPYVYYPPISPPPYTITWGNPCGATATCSSVVSTAATAGATCAGLIVL